MQINKEKLQKNLDEKWKAVHCPYCNDHKWTVDPTIMTLVEVEENKQITLGGKFQPLVAVTCRCCGNVALVNTLILDCIDEKEYKEVIYLIRQTKTSKIILRIYQKWKMIQNF